jgi:hypothetical protein
LGFYCICFMKTALLLLCTLVLFSRPAAAQCLGLPDLLSLAMSSPRMRPAQLAALLPDWNSRGAVTKGDDELYWVLLPASAYNEDSLAVAWLSLRPNQDGRDVVYKAIKGNCLEALRRELARKKYPATLVTSLGGGEGVRFTAPTFTVSLYIRPKGPFPYVAVLHLTESTTQPEQANSVNRRVLPPSGVPRLQPRY